jgi:toxin CcdB
MGRFDIYRNRGRQQTSVPYLLDVQSNHLEGLSTRIVIPLRRRDRLAEVKLPKDLTPVFMIEGIECFLDTPQLAAIPASELKNQVSSLANHQLDIHIALDRLFGGF